MEVVASAVVVDDVIRDSTRLKIPDSATAVAIK
jgi:hypothetical protein